MQEGGMSFPSSVAKWDCSEGGWGRDTLLLPAKTGYCFGGDSKRKRLNYSLAVRVFAVYSRKCRAVGVQCSERDGRKHFHSVRALWIYSFWTLEILSHVFTVVPVKLAPRNFQRGSRFHLGLRPLSFILQSRSDGNHGVNYINRHFKLDLNLPWNVHLAPLLQISERWICFFSQLFFLRSTDFVTGLQK